MPDLTKNYLWMNIRELPYFRALLRAVEARFYQELDLPSPLLDVGCGDGHFASIAFDNPLEAGIDPWSAPLAKAHRYGSYRLLLQGQGDNLPFSSGAFASAISNSVLEHIENIQPVLDEVARVLTRGAPFVFCVPNHLFSSNLSVSKVLDRAGFKRMALGYRDFFNRVSRHKHCDPPEVWEERLRISGFKIIKWWHYFSPEALKALEWGHYFGIPSWLIHEVTGRWILVPKKWNLSITMRYLQKYYEEAKVQLYGSYTFYITEKI